MMKEAFVLGGKNRVHQHFRDFTEVNNQLFFAALIEEVRDDFRLQRKLSEAGMAAEGDDPCNAALSESGSPRLPECNRPGRDESRSCLPASDTIPDLLPWIQSIRSAVDRMQAPRSSASLPATTVRGAA